MRTDTETELLYPNSSPNDQRSHFLFLNNYAIRTRDPVSSLCLFNLLDRKAGAWIYPRCFAVEVLRFTATGNGDPNFTNPIFRYIGNGGTAVEDVPNGIAIQTNGDIVVAGGPGREQETKGHRLRPSRRVNSRIDGKRALLDLMGQPRRTLLLF